MAETIIDMSALTWINTSAYAVTNTSFQICFGNNQNLTLNPDGTIVHNLESADEATMVFLDSLKTIYPQWIKQLVKDHIANDTIK